MCGWRAGLLRCFSLFLLGGVLAPGVQAQESIPLTIYVPPTIKSTVEFTAYFFFSEAVTGFDTGDVTVTGGTKGTFTEVSASSYTLAVTPADGSDVTVEVAAGAANDGGGNPFPPSTVSATATWDDPPTVAITGVPAAINSTAGFTATFTFSEDVTGFATGDVTVTGGTKGAFTEVSASSYTLAVTPTGSADVVVTVAADSATDGVGNTGPATAVSATATWDYPPTVRISGVPAKINSRTAFTATFTFSEPVTGFDAADVVVSGFGSSKGAFTEVSATEYTLVVTPGSGLRSEVIVLANTATDSFGNTGPARNVRATATWDLTAPTVSITGVPASIETTAAFTVTFTFSEDVAGFDATDVTVTGGTKGARLNRRGRVYTLAVTPTGSADVTVTVAADAATDGVNTGPVAAKSATAKWDPAPTVSIGGVPSSIDTAAGFTATFNFSEDVTGFDAADVTVAGGAKVAFRAVSASSYTLAVKPAGGSDVTVWVLANSATDGLNTGPPEAVSATATWDAAALWVRIGGVPSGINSTAAFTATFSFTEDVTGFDAGDVTVTGGAKGAFAAVSGTEYTLAVTPAGSADVTVTVAANAATGGNSNTGPASAVSATAAWDAAPPTVAITGVPASIDTTAAFTATFTFSEPVTGFSAGDVTVGGGSRGAFAGSGTTYTLAVTPAGGVDVTVEVAANAATDGVGNTGPASAVSATATWPPADARAVILTGYGREAPDAPLTCSTRPITSRYVMPEGSNGGYCVQLATEPSGPVTVTITGTAGTDLTLDPTSLTFDPSGSNRWSRPQPVLWAVTEDNDSSNELATLLHTASGSDYGGVTASLPILVRDNDARRELEISSSSGPLGGPNETLWVTEGSSNTYTVALASQPSAPVTVSIRIQNRGLRDTAAQSLLTLDATSLTFNPSGSDLWSTPQTVTVSAGHDIDAIVNYGTLVHTVSGGGYDGVTAEVRVTVSDDDPGHTLLFSTDSLKVAEGGNAAYTVRLSSPPDGNDLQVNIDGWRNTDLRGLGGSLTFTDQNWSTPQTVTVHADRDSDLTNDRATLVHRVTRQRFTPWEGVTGRVAVETVDDRGRGIVLTPSRSGNRNRPLSQGVDEGRRATWTVALAGQPPAPVTVSISGHSGTDLTLDRTSLTFNPTGSDLWSTPQTVTVYAGEDDDATDEEAELVHTATGLGHLAATSLWVATNDDDNEGIALADYDSQLPGPDTFGKNVAEGGSASFTVALTSQPSAPVSVSISGHSGTDLTLDKTRLTFTPVGSNLWSTPQTVTIYAGQDIDSADDAVVLRLQDSGSGRYRFARAFMVVNVEDDDKTREPEIVLTPSDSLTVTEGDSTTYTVRLATRPSVSRVSVAIRGADLGPGAELRTDRLLLAFTDRDWSTPHTVTVTAGQDADSDNDTRTLEHQGYGGDYEGLLADLEVTTADDDATGKLLFSPGSVTVAEGRSDSYTVRLSSEPTAPVTVTITGTADTDLTLDATSLTFNPSGSNLWSTPQRVTVSAGQDLDGSNDTATLVHAASGGDYTGETGSLEVTTADDDLPPPSIGGVPSSIDTTAAFTATFTFSESVSGFTTADITVTGGTKGAFTEVSGYEYTLAVTPAGDADVTVTVRANAATGTGRKTGPASAVSATAAWDDGVLPTVTISGVPDRISSTTAFTATFTFSESVTGFTTADVTVTGGTKGAFTEVSATSYTLAITPAGSADVVVTVAADSATDGSGSTGPTTEQSATATWSREGVTVSESALTLTEGGASDTYTVVLDSDPGASVVITVAPDDATAVAVDTDSVTTGDQNTLTFTHGNTGNWGTAQTVTVRAVEDGDAVGEQNVMIGHTAAVSTDTNNPYHGIDIDDVEVDVTDAGHGLIVDPAALDVRENGGEATYTIRLKSQPGGTVVVTPTSDDTSHVTVSGTFTFNDSNWDDPQDVTVTGAGADTDTATIENDVTTATSTYPTSFSEDVDVTVTADPRPVVTIAGGSAVTEGAAASFTLTATPAPSSALTVSLSVADAPAPSDFVLAANEGAGKTATVGTDGSGTFTVATVGGSGETADEPNGPVTVTLPAAGADADYQAGAASSAEVTVVDDDATVVSLSRTGSATVTEGGTVEFTVSIPRPLIAGETIDVPLSIGGGASVTTDDWSLALKPGQNLNTGVSLSGQATATPQVRLSGAGAQTATLVLTAQTDSVAEAGGETLTVALGPDGTGANGFDRTSLGTSVGGGADPHGTSNSFSVQVNDPAGLTASPTSLALTEGHATDGTDTYTVVLDTDPGAGVTVTVTPTSGDAGAATVSPASRAFTGGPSGNWETAQSFTVTAVEDGDVANESFNVTHTATAPSGNPYHNLSGVGPVAVTVTDAGHGLILSTSTLNVRENGGEATYTIRLKSQPGGTVTVTPDSSDDTHVEVSGPVSFNNSDWDSPQTVTVTGVGDATDTATIDNDVTTATATYPTSFTESVAVTVTADPRPTVAIGGVPAKINSRTAFTATFTFSAAVTGFTTADVNVTGGAKGAFAGSGNAYTLAVTPAGSADVVVTVAANSATAGGNTGPPTAESATATWDATVPTLTIGGVPAKINSRTAFTATFTFSEDVTDFVTGDVTVTGGTKGAFAEVSASSYTLAVTPAGSADVVVTVAAGAATDGVNTAPTSAESATATWDATVPTVRIRGVPAKINSTDAFTATFEFSEDVTGFVTGDVTVTGGSKGTFTAVSGTEYTLVVTPTSGSNVTVEVAANAATDGVNTAPASAESATATWDADAPTLTIGGVPAKINSTTAFTATFTFSEDVTDFVTGDVTVTGGTKGAFTEVSASSYTLAVTPTSGSNVTVEVAANAATDGVNTGPPSAVSATATWTEIVLTPTALDVDEGDSNTYTVRLSSQPTAAVTVTITVPGGTDLTLDATSLTFNPTGTSLWSTAQTVTVTAGGDADVANDTATLVHTAAGGDYAGLTKSLVVTTDDAGHGLIVDPATLNVRENGGTATYTVRLKSQPGGTVVVTPSSTDSTHVTVSGTFTFNDSNWDDPQDVTVTGAGDATDTATIENDVTTPTATYPTTFSEDVDVTVTADSRPVIGIAADAGEITEGDTAAFTVTVDAAPSSDLTVRLTVLDSTVGNSDFIAAGDEGAKTVLIPSGQTEAAFTVDTVGGADETEDDTNSNISVALSEDPGYRVDAGNGEADVKVLDNDATTLALEVTDATATEGDADDTAAFTLTLSRALAGNELGPPVRVDRRLRVRLVDAPMPRFAEDGRRRGEDQIVDAVEQHGVQQHLRAGHVVGIVFRGVGHRLPDFDVRGEMHDAVKPGSMKQPIQQCPVAQVALHEPPVRHRIAPPRRQVVQRRDLDTGLAEAPDHVRTDVARASRDQYMHG